MDIRNLDEKKMRLGQLACEIRDVEASRDRLDAKIKELEIISTDICIALDTELEGARPTIEMFNEWRGEYSVNSAMKEIEVTQTWRNDVGRKHTALKREERELLRDL